MDYLIRGQCKLWAKMQLNLEITDLNASKVTVSKEDFELDDIFGVQDELSDEILNELQISLGVSSGKATTGQMIITRWKTSIYF